MKLTLSFLFLLLILSSCKKEHSFGISEQEPYYGISDNTKEYFFFQKGSYWIYENDSTKLFDSTYITDIYHTTEDHNYDGMIREIIDLTFKSQFLSMFRIYYFYCANIRGPDYSTVEGIYKNPNDTSQIVTGGPVAYFPFWAPETKIISQSCLPGAVFTYRIIPVDTVNNTIYNNIIWSKIISIDSSSINPYFYSREIYFAKNIGIIKYFEIERYYNVHRSLSLKRYKIIQ